MNKLLIIGAGGHSKVILEIAELMNNWKEISFLDDKLIGESINGYKVIDSIRNCKSYKNEYQDVFIAIGDNNIREKLYLEFKDDFIFPRLIHPFSCISPNANIGEGTVIIAGAIINTNTEIGKCSIINTSATIGHDCMIGDFVHISPGTNIAGTTTIGNNSWICMGSKVINNIYIGKNVIVASGGIVIEDVKDNILVGGIPAKIIKDLA